MTSPALAAAQALAAAAHHGQLDKAGRPYIEHPIEVSRIVRLQGGNEDAQIVALLHDVVEDTAVSLGDLQSLGYPDAILHAVEALTHRDDESRESYIARVHADPIARCVKYADLTTNSDPARLSYLPVETQARLTAKYQRDFAQMRALDRDLQDHSVARMA